MTNEGLWITDIGSMVPQHDRKQEQEEADQHRIENYILENPQVTAFLAVDHTTAVMTYKILKKLNLDQEKELVFLTALMRKMTPARFLPMLCREKERLGERLSGI